MKLTIHRVALIVVALTASSYGQLSVNLPGENGFTFSGDAYSAPTAKQDADGYEALETATTFDLFVSTPDDILVVDFTLDVAHASVFQIPNPYGSQTDLNIRPPPQGAIDANPQFGADSWVTTRGLGTACAESNAACPGFENVGEVSHFDSSNDGPQTDFHFARITLIPDETGNFSAEFSGVVHVANQPRPLLEPFSFTFQSVPEPNSMGLLMTALLGGLAMARGVRSRRR